MKEKGRKSRKGRKEEKKSHNSCHCSLSRTTVVLPLHRHQQHHEPLQVSLPPLPFLFFLFLFLFFLFHRPQLLHCFVLQVNSGDWINLLSTVHVAGEQWRASPLFLGRTALAQTKMVGSGPVQKRKKKKISHGSSWPTSCPIYSGPISAQPWWAHPNIFGPTHLFIFIIYYYYIVYNKFQKKFQKSFWKFVIFSCIFIPFWLILVCIFIL